MDRNTFFCAEESRQLGEDPIGTGDHYYQTYIFVECPIPWKKDEFGSKSIPDNLKALQAEIYEQFPPIRLLLIYNEKLWQENFTRLLIYRRQDNFPNRYQKQECLLTNIKEAVPIVKEYLLNGNFPNQAITTETRDIFVCTHGSHDKCCAKYGYPFYRQASATVADLSLNHVRVWQASHFGDHRFAPTMMDFPEGRYYARLDRDSFTSVLTRTGDIHCFKNIYRGWSILPEPAQFLEREMIFLHGWNWFDYKVAATVIEQKDDISFSRIEINFEKPDGSLGVVRGDVVEDKNKAIYLLGGCECTEVWRKPQFCVQNLTQMQPCN
jgi:hypothetical protein